MDYFNVYYKLVNYRKENVLTKNYEIHHIKPKCMGGNNEYENLVRLTYREHFFAHKLLTLMYKNNEKLLYSYYKMNNYRGRHHNSKHYEKVKSKFYKFLSKRMKINNPMKGKDSPMKGKNHTKDTIEKISKRTKELFKDPEYRLKHRLGVSRGVSGEKHPMFGKTHTRDSKLKMSISSGGRKFSVFKNGRYIGSWISQTECCKDLNLKSVGNLNVCLKRGTFYGEFNFIYE